MNYQIFTIPLENLLVNSNNPRINPVDNEDSAIKELVDNQSVKLLNLAKDISLHGLLPSIRPIVFIAPDEDDKFIVADANRRITCLKLILNNEYYKERYPDQRLLISRFAELATENIPTQIECIVYENEEDTLDMLQKIHTGNNSGVGQDNWGATETSRFKDLKGIKSERYEVLKLMRESEYTDPTVRDALDANWISKLERLVKDPAILEFIGITFDHDKNLVLLLEEKEVLKPLNKIGFDFAVDKMRADVIWLKEDRENYISSFPNEFIPNRVENVTTSESNASSTTTSNNNTHSNNTSNADSTDSATSSTTSTTQDMGTTSTGTNSSNSSDSNVAGSATNASTSNGSRARNNRRYLVPRDFRISISSPKVNKILNELKSLSLESFGNSAGILLRVFIVFSIDIYLDVTNTQLNDSQKRDAHKRLMLVLEILKNKGILNDSEIKPVKTIFESPNNVLSLHTLNSFVHNIYTQPTPTDLKIGWDNIQHFIAALWTSINAEES